MATTVRERNKAYLLSDLQSGDRFYFVSDKKRKPFTLADPPFENRRNYGFWIKYAYCVPDLQPLNGAVEQHKANRSVIFLRNINDSDGHST